MKKRKTEQILWGLFFIVAAVILITNRLGIFQTAYPFSIWKLIVSVFLIIGAVKCILKIEFTPVLFSIALICIMYSNELGISALSPWTILLAALLLSIGFEMLFHNKKNKYKNFNNRYTENNYDNFQNEFNNQNNFDRNYSGNETGSHSEPFQNVEYSDSDVVVASTSFGSSVKYINSGNFTKANISCNFGAMKVYFDNAVIQNEFADVFIDVSFGGVELYVPRTWSVFNNISATLAGVDEKNKSISNGVPVLRLSGSASFSGITIIYI